MMMGIYLLVIGIHDMQYREVFFEHSGDWTRSGVCIFIGTITMISTEVVISHIDFADILILLSKH